MNTFGTYICEVIKREDHLWKGLLDETFPEFIRFIYPRVDEFLDLEKGVEFLDKELEKVFSSDDKPSTRLVDKLVKVYTLDGDEQWILIHIEVQAKYTEDFGNRMFTYFYRLLDKYNKRISAFAIFTEAIPKSRPDTFKIEFMDTEMNYKFNTYKITDPTDEELESSKNIFALVVIAARAVLKERHITNKKERDLFRKDLKIQLLKELKSRKIEQKKIDSIWKFINYYIRFEFEETNIIFDKELNILNKKNITMGIEEAIRDIIREETAEKVEKEMKEKFARKLVFDLKCSDRRAAKLLEVSVKFVKRIREKELVLS
ncbi:hypothetical protein [Pedobacter sp. L105]|uniref:hypothetical protein n=1 Tax=Pedobacter sp. L105 TaxID=1641871 RepID=UPI00131B8CBE|nr:hypothetical protein [Pedobacter sp. L105]